MPTNAERSPIEVVHLVSNLGKGGAEKQLYLLASQSSPDFHHRVLAICAEGPWAKELRAKGIAVDCLGASFALSPEVLLRAIRYLRSRPPDLVHSWLPSMNLLGVLVLWLGRLGRIGMIASIRNVDDWKPGWRLALERWVSQRWDAVICNSHAGLVCSLKAGIRKDLLHYVANGLPAAAQNLSRAEARAKFGIGEDSVVVACASRLVPQKRISIVLDAASQLPEIYFLIAGDGPLLGELKRQAPSNIRMLGVLTDTASLFAAADIFLSVSEREGTSNSLLEALQASCAALVTDVGDNIELSGAAGLVVTPVTVVRQLKQLLADRATLARLRNAAKKRACAYTVAAMVSSTEDVYRVALKKRGRRTKKILYLDYTNGIGMGGGQRSLLLILANLNRNRFRAVLACPNDETWRELVPADIRVVDLPLPVSFRRLTRSSAGWIGSLQGAMSAMASVWAVRRLIQRERIDVVHANNMKVALLAGLATSGTGVPVLWHVRDILPETGIAKTSRRIASALATRVIAVSEAVARQFSGATELVHNAVQLPNLENVTAIRTAYRGLHHIPLGAFVFGYVGRIDPGKGIELLLEAFASIGERHPNAWLLIAGEGATRAAFMDRAALQGGKRIVWTGFEVSPGSAFAAMDCGVVPSVEPDSFPRAVIEAMSWALPVIGSSSGGIGEAIMDGQTGAVVPIGDARALAREMDVMAGDPALARSWGERGRQSCAKRFAVDGQMVRIETLYGEVLRGA